MSWGDVLGGLLGGATAGLVGLAGVALLGTYARRALSRRGQR